MASCRLLRGLSGQARLDYTQYLRHNRELLQRIMDILKDDLEVSLKEMRSVDSYDKPAWSEFQADKLGEQRAYAKMIALLTLDREDNDE